MPSSSNKTSNHWLSQLPDALGDETVRLAARPSREAIVGPVSQALDPRLKDRLQNLGIEDLYSHQSEAVEKALQGRDLMIATGTNSGKSLCYNLPALHRILAEPNAKALYLFPTKALARDQAAKLEQLAPPGLVRVGAYDGDTPRRERGTIRNLAHVLITNPDMLHVGILPSHELWGSFLKSLRVIVIDELHAYRGVFGSHVAGVIRRLLRLAEWRRARPQIIACSATVANPTELFQQLTGRTPDLINTDGSPSGERTLAFWNPSLHEADPISGNVATGHLLAHLASQQVRTLAFSRSRVGSELVLRYARQQMENLKGDPARLDNYRAGYTQAQRRTIEANLAKGKLLGLSATNALELGIDVGDLDAVLLNGYPGTRAGFWQQVGRAGRGRRDGLAVFVAGPDPLEQFIVRSPEGVLAADPEPVILQSDNPFILAQQLKCAAYERPVAEEELPNFGPNAPAVAQELSSSGECQLQAGRLYFVGTQSPAPQISIRSASNQAVRLLAQGEELGAMELWRSKAEAHEGAIYLHRGATYEVESLDLVTRVAHLQPATPDYYTRTVMQPVLQQTVSVEEQARGEFKLGLAGFSVTELITGYRQISITTGKTLESFPLSLPPDNFSTIGVRLDLPEIEAEEDGEAAAIHALEHALAEMAPWIAGCDRGDLGSAWYLTAPDSMRPAVFIFDRVPGGIGLSERLYQEAKSWIDAAIKLVAECKCENGCPLCLYTSRCELSNDLIDKAGALKLLRKIGAALKEDST